jgi:membrane associated rhomboid family serine protease
MIPIRDTIRARSFPLVNTTLIVINVLIFIFENSLSPQALDKLVYNFGMVPVSVLSGGVSQWITVFTSMFLHGSWMHLISNMLAMYIFGDNVEDRLGHWRYLVFYLLGGTLAGLVHIFIYPDSQLPTVGASGAIAVILGAYLVLYPKARVVTLVPIIFFFSFVEIPAVVYLGFWFLSQLFSGTLALAVNTFQSGGVAFWVHIGGFIFGVIMVKLFAPRHRRIQYLDEYYPW